MRPNSIIWLRPALILLLGGLVSGGCAAKRPASTEEGALPRRESLREMDPVRIQGDIMGFADRFVTAMVDVYAELGQVTERWYGAHPDLRYVSHVHLAGLPVPNAPPARPEEGPGSVFAFLFKPTPKLDPAVHEVELSRATSERMFFYLQRMPML